MEITVTRTGGIAGVNEQLGPVDTSGLEPEQAAQIERLVDEIGFFELPEALPPGRGFDFLYYRATVRSDSAEHSVTWDDGTPDEDAESVQRLVRALVEGGFEFEAKERQ